MEMKNLFASIRVLAVAPLTLLLLFGLLAATTQAAATVLEVRGHGYWHGVVGLPSEGQEVDQVSINAWVATDDSVGGRVVWTSVYNPLPGGGGRAVSGWPVVIEVTELELLDGNTVRLEGVVVRSPQSPGDVGIVVEIIVTDNGNGASGSPDEINSVTIFIPGGPTIYIPGGPILGGNFTIRSQ